MRRDRNCLLLATGSIFALLFCCQPAANAYWTRTVEVLDASATWTGPSPGAAGYYSSSVYVYAYQGQTSAYAEAEASYRATFTWQGQGTGVGQYAQDGSISGTLGFYSNPQNPSYRSTAGISQTGPPDYSRTEPYGLRIDVDGITAFSSDMSVSCHVDNYGHSSATYSFGVSV